MFNDVILRIGNNENDIYFDNEERVGIGFYYSLYVDLKVNEKIEDVVTNESINVALQRFLTNYGDSIHSNYGKNISEICNCYDFYEYFSKDVSFYIEGDLDTVLKYIKINWDFFENKKIIFNVNLDVDYDEFYRILLRSRMLEAHIKKNPLTESLGEEVALKFCVVLIFDEFAEKYDMEKDIKSIKLIRTLREHVNYVNEEEKKKLK